MYVLGSNLSELLDSQLYQALMFVQLAKTFWYSGSIRACGSLNPKSCRSTRFIINHEMITSYVMKNFNLQRHNVSLAKLQVF